MSDQNASKESSMSGKSVYSTYNDDIVISGIAGRFPDSDNMYQLKENLLNKVDLISDDDRRWNLDHPEIPKRSGKVNNIEKFDAPFFGIHSKQAHTMDPLCRMLMEHAYEAVIDAGVNPRQLRGTRTGVFVGVCFSESEQMWVYQKPQLKGLGLTGCSRALLANRISYWLGITGPSYTVDTACSSSLTATENAYRAIRSGQCDAALVGGINICLHPYVTLQFARLGILSMDGRCRSFDADASGYVRSEALGLVYLQKVEDAKRIYATLVHSKINCDGYKEQGLTFPSSIMQRTLLKEFYEECGIPPTSLSYVEAHGTGTTVGDPEELQAIDEVFCRGRTTPLRIGSVKSNLGHSEAASGVCSIAKVIIAMETGMLPPNLHYNHPRDGLKAIEEGRIEVISELTPWEGGYSGINSFGFGGANAHVLLKSNPFEKINGGLPSDNLPRLVVISGRTKEAVDVILKDVEGRPVDVEYVRLFQDIHSTAIPGHMYRGYTVVGGSATKENPRREIHHYPGAKRPIWFVFSGMGSQWPGMGAALLRLPVFAEAIKKCDAALKPRGIDIYDILTNTSKSTFDNILNSFVGIAAVQIGLVDILRHVGIIPDKIIGHSVGELGCAYADGCFTAEEMVLAAYSRGLASIETDLIYGSMAAVGLGYQDIKNMCPADIDVACHNGPESSTISGPVASVNAFVSKLKGNKVFAKEVPCSNIAFHSRYIAAAGTKLLAYLEKVIPEPKLRSDKWLSSSVRRTEWHTAKAQYSCAEYHTNNLLNPVLFEETSALIPKDAVTIEIAPHGLLQAIIRRSLHSEVTNIALTQRYHNDNVEAVLQGLGKLFTIGLQPNIANLFPAVRYPVSRGTPMISPLIKWDHSDDWYVASYKMNQKVDSCERKVEISLMNLEFEYINGHVIDGRLLFPATGYLALVWETFAMMRDEFYTDISVVFEDVKFLRATTIAKENSVDFTVVIIKGSGRFEIDEGGMAVVTGNIRYTAKPSEEMLNVSFPNNNDEVEEMSGRDFYKELRLRGYQYSGLFRSVKSSTICGSKGTIVWENNWVAFMDNMLQMNIQATDSRGLFVPTGIQKLTIDTKTHLSTLREMTNEEKLFTVRLIKIYDTTISGGVEIRGLKANAISRRKPIGEPVLESYGFVAHYDRAETSLKEIVRLAGNIALENHLGVKVKTIEAVDSTVAPALEDIVSPFLLETLCDIPLIQADVSIVASVNPFDDGLLPENIGVTDPKKITTDTAALLVSGRNLFTCAKNETIDQLQLALKEGGFLLTRENGDTADIKKAAENRRLDVVFEKRVNNETVLLFRKRSKLLTNTVFINVASKDLDWIPELKSVLKTQLDSDNSNRIVLVSEKDFESGLLGLVNCLRREPGGDRIRGYLIQDKKAPNFSQENPLYANQLKLDLAINVLRPNGVWGTYRHLKLSDSIEKPVYHAWATQLVRGDLSSFLWLEGPFQPSSDQRNLARVIFTSVNFKDVMLATGKLAIEVVTKDRLLQECPFGFEYSGVDSSKRRIMGVIESRSFANIITIDKYLTWVIPDNWSFEDAATVPCVYATCLYALYMTGKMKKGDKVLIHAGSGGIGQAAITLALHEGCEVFTTVGTPDKRQFIKQRFPEIADDHIGNSRNTSFEQMIMEQTNGQGVDIVLNSLSEDKLLASVRCLAHSGRFLEIGKFDLAANNPLGMEVFLKEVSFHGVMLDNLLLAPESKRMELQKMMQLCLNGEAIKPVTRTVFPMMELEKAFRYMAAGKHIGKVLINIYGENDPIYSPLKALPHFHCQDNRSYIILGGLGGFGLELADWLVLRGAKNLVLTSRTGIKNGYQKKRIELWKSYGTRVHVMSGKNAWIRQDCEDILKTASKIAPVDAIFNLAVVLKDALMENQTQENFVESLKCKAWSTKQLDELSRKLCPKLQHFVVFSSVSCGRGNAGQTNYGMSNSIMERICERRVAEGLPGLAVQWGAVGDVGLVAEMQEEHKELVISGTLQQRISSCLVELNKFLKQGSPIVSSMVVAEKRAGGAGSLNMIDTVLNIIGLKDLKSVSQHTSLAELGMDSMMAVEIKQTFEREFDIFLSPQDLRSLNFAKILEMSKAVDEKKIKSDKTNELLSGMKLLTQLLGDRKMEQKLCLKLQTQAEEGNEIFLIPGIEGYGTVFENLVTKIRSPATCLQLLNTSAEQTTIDEMAQQFLPHLLERIKSRRDFVIVGYSFGSVIAIELARKLEAEGSIGKLILIDGSPELFNAIKSQQISGTTDDELQDAILLGLMDIVSPSTTSDFHNALKTCSTWAERLDTFISRAPPQGSFTVTDQRNFCTSFLYRLRALDKYDHTNLPPIKSSIVLLKPTVSTVKTASFDYGLGAMTRMKVDVFTVEGNHISILDNSKVAAVINDEPIEDDVPIEATLMKDDEISIPNSAP